MRLFLVRHATPLHEGRLAGRRDVAADCSDRAAFARLAPRLPDDAWVSPALRCKQTAAALGRAGASHPALWEQHYGEWEDQPFDALPDLGDLSPAALAAHRPPGGESFDDMAARVTPLLASADRDLTVVAHAGTVRAGLSMVVGPAALSFAVAPLSLTILHRAGRHWSVEAVNVTP